MHLFWANLTAPSPQLCEPTKRVVYCTSAPVAEEVVQYYLRIVCGSRGVNPQQARERLLMICCHDTDPLQVGAGAWLVVPRRWVPRGTT